MSVYVDELRQTTPTRRWPFPSSCHLVADSADELDAFGQRLGLKRTWRDGDHYDLTAPQRYRAVKQGAQEVTRRDVVRIRNRQKGQGGLFQEGGAG